MNKNIILCGFMGSGKTVTGKALANRLNMDFIDIDAFIEENEKTSISDIFEKKGEEYFRNLETKAAITLGSRQNTVISCGGGTVLNPKNVTALKQNGDLFYLSVTPETVIKRLKNNSSRPLLAENKEEKIKTLLKSRLPFYKAVADYIIDSNQTVDFAVEQILKILGEA